MARVEVGRRAASQRVRSKLEGVQLVVAESRSGPIVLLHTMRLEELLGISYLGGFYSEKEGIERKEGNDQIAIWAKNA